jgi:hypothetical protein
MLGWVHGKKRICAIGNEWVDNPYLIGRKHGMPDPKDNENFVVTCLCGARGVVDKKWLMFASRIVRVGPKMYMQLPNRWYWQTSPFAESIYVCAHCMFEHTYEILNAVRNAMQKHGEFEKILNGGS